jgi:hypothetical protein
LIEAIVPAQEAQILTEEQIQNIIKNCNTQTSKEGTSRYHLPTCLTWLYLPLAVIGAVANFRAINNFIDTFQNSPLRPHLSSVAYKIIFGVEISFYLVEIPLHNLLSFYLNIFLRQFLNFS